MSTVVHASLSWFPLVPRPRPSCHPLKERVTELAALADDMERGTRQECVTRAAEVFNKAALIASDCGMPMLTRELCQRQYEQFARSMPLPGWAVRLALQPVLNIPRQLIRDGRPNDAHALLQALHHAALGQTTCAADGMSIDFGTLTTAADGHREASTLTWTALLADGARALARAGRWAEAAERATAHRGIGIRLLDGRQALILALLTSGHPIEAAAATEEAEPVHPWEHTVRAILRVLCQRVGGGAPGPATVTMLAAACTLVQALDPATVAARARIGLVAYALADPGDAVLASALRDVLIASASTDGYAARDLLASPSMSNAVTSAQRMELEALVRKCGLDAGTIPRRFHSQLADMTDRAACTLTLRCRDWQDDELATAGNAPHAPDR